MPGRKNKGEIIQPDSVARNFSKPTVGAPNLLYVEVYLRCPSKISYILRIPIVKTGLLMSRASQYRPRI